MKQKFYLFTSILQLVVGLAAIAAYLLMAVSKEPMGQWTITLVLAIVFLIMGLCGILGQLRRKE